MPLVANAGTLEEALFGMIRQDQVRRLLDTNVAGTSRRSKPGHER